MKVQVPEHLVAKDIKGKAKANSSLKRKRNGLDNDYRGAFSAGMSIHQERRVHWEDHLPTESVADLVTGPIAGPSTQLTDRGLVPSVGWSNNNPEMMKQNRGRPVKPRGRGSRTPAVRGSRS